MNAETPTEQSPADDPAERPVALVTGAGRRIGSAVARALAGRGYRLLLHVNRSRAEAEVLAREFDPAATAAHVLAADFADSSAIERMLSAAGDRFGRIDALVNCAAIWQPGPLEQVTADQVRRHFEINVLGTFLCCQQVGLRMAAQAAGGAIVNFGDIATQRPAPDYSAYFASKGAIEGLTRALAVELGRRNPRVRVNALLPGPVLLADDASPAERRYTIEGTLVRRLGTGQDLAHAVLFLLENTFITGVCLPIDGGRSVFDSGASERNGGAGL